MGNLGKLEAFAPFFVLGVNLGAFLYRPAPETVLALTIAVIFFMGMAIIPKLMPLDKPTALEAQLRVLEAKLTEMEKSVNINAEYSAKEFSTLKSAIQIKQLGR